MPSQILEKAIRDVVKSLLDMPSHKIKYVIVHLSYVEGLWGCLNRYGVEFNKNNHEIVVDTVQEILEGPDFEREWTREEYDFFVNFKPKEVVYGQS